MRRDERSVTDIEKIFDILSRCDTISVSMNGGTGYPYTVPMTFGAELNDGKITVFFHCAGEGRKWDILNSDPRVCIEANRYYKTMHTADGEITAGYESVIGTGIAERVAEQSEKIASMKCMLAHYNESGFPVTSCKGLQKVEVFKIVLNEVCGKHNL